MDCGLKKRHAEINWWASEVPQDSNVLTTSQFIVTTMFLMQNQQIKAGYHKASISITEENLLFSYRFLSQEILFLFLCTFLLKNEIIFFLKNPQWVITAPLVESNSAVGSLVWDGKECSAHARGPCTSSHKGSCPGELSQLDASCKNAGFPQLALTRVTNITDSDPTWVLGTLTWKRILTQIWPDSL